MRLRIVLITTALLLTTSTALSQTKRRATKPRITKVTIPAITPRIPAYQLHLRIGAGPKLNLSVISSSREDAISPEDLNSLIADLPAGASTYSEPNNTFPKVMVEASPTIAMLDFWNPLTLFRTDRTNMTLSLPENTSVSIIWPQTDNIDVKPSPLLLFVEIDGANKLTLNNEASGSLLAPQPLQDMLKKIFKEREVNGIFHPDTNEVESEVTIVMPMSGRKFSDLVKIVDVVKKAGAGWIFLTESHPIAVPVPFMLEDLPPIPVKKRPR